MKRKRIVLIVLVFLLTIITTSNLVFATLSPTEAMDGMIDGGKVDEISGVTGKIGPVINAAIALIQFTGTGISLIMVTILGIKYILASPSDKADVKKQITPMLIGCVILFASVNLVQLVANFTNSTFGG